MSRLLDLLHRREIAHLQAWAARRPHKPIVIRGARQVGKSTLVREFARTARLTLMTVDFERDPELRDAFTHRDPARILALLKLLTGKTAEAGKHLLFLDEIQAAGSRVVPVEVKAGASGSLKSLQQFIREKSADLALRFSADTPSLMRESRRLPNGAAVSYDLLSLPLYLVGQARRLVEELVTERSS